MTNPLAEAPRRAGIGLRGPHLAAVVASPPAVGFLEVHPENYMGGGPALAALERLRRDRPISLHGVGLSLGGTDGVDAGHLARLAALVERLEPVLVSEHLSWSIVEGIYLNDLLPLPYTEEALEITARHIDQVQARLGRSILVEHPSSYLDIAIRPSTSPSSWLSSCAVPAACCATSTTSLSAPAISGSIRRPISPGCRPPPSANSISRATA